MLLRPTALLLVCALALPLLAVDPGNAEGTFIVNGDPTSLHFAFAMKEKDFDEKDRWVVVATDRPVYRSLLGDSTRFSRAIEKGELSAVLLHFGEDRSLQQVEIRSSRLQHKSLPVMVSDVELSGFQLGDGMIAGAVKTTEEQTFFDDVGSLQLSFSAAVGERRFGDNAPAAKALSGSVPPLSDGAASGTLTVDGKAVQLRHALARTKPNSFDETKKDVVVLLTDSAVAPEVLIEQQRLWEMVEKGTLHGLLLTIDAEEKPYHLQLLHPAANIQISGTGIFEFDAIDYSPRHVTAKFFTSEEQDFMGEHRYGYEVRFAVPVSNVLAPSEVTVDAASGKALPAGGGAPGKAYLAFDKAARAGNLAELKKLGSEARPLPDVSEAELQEMIEFIKSMRPAKLQILGGFVSADHATLSVIGEDPADATKMRGTIEMTLEKGLWKLIAEKWKVGE